MYEKGKESFDIELAPTSKTSTGGRFVGVQFINNISNHFIICTNKMVELLDRTVF